MESRRIGPKIGYRGAVGCGYDVTEPRAPPEQETRIGTRSKRKREFRLGFGEPEAKVQCKHLQRPFVCRPTSKPQQAPHPLCDPAVRANAGDTRYICIGRTRKLR